MQLCKSLKFWLSVIILNSIVCYNVFADNHDSLFSICTGTVQNISESTESNDYEIAYQVGAFKNIKNAKLFAKELLSQGFYGEIREKLVNESELWVVTVSKEQNPFIDRQKELLDAGYISFPVKILY